LFFVCRKAYEYDPVPRGEENEYSQIGGWLVLLCLGLILTPLYTMVTLVKGNFTNVHQWKMLVDTSYADYNPVLGGFVLFEFMTELAFFAFSILVLILFLKRRSSTPHLLSALYIFNVVYIVATAISGSFLELYTASETRSNINDILRALLIACIWIPYLFLSERSKQTFTVRV
jgi:hypothetical protein